MSIFMKRFSHTIAAVSILAAGITLSGCGMSSLGTKAPDPGSSGIAGVLRGNIHGGQQPVSGSRITIYAATTNGYNVAATSIMAAPGYVTSDAGGNFGLTGTYTCPTNSDGSSALVYIVATGGNPGLGTNNNALRMMAALGSCATLQANAATTFISINEVTTVGSAYALSGFMSSPTQVSSSNTAAGIRGLTAAFANTNLLVNTSNGGALSTTPSGSATVPFAKINALANALATCINSNGSTSAGTSCGTLFAATTVGGVVPADTLQAVINVTHAPGQNVATIYNMQSPSSPFAPTPSTTPNDWTMPLIFTGGGISAPQAVAIDSLGGAWVVSKTNSMNRIQNGTFLYGSAGTTDASFDAPSSVAIDSSSQVWIANCGDSCSASGKAASVSKFNFFTGFSKYSGNGLNAAYSLAIDGSDNVWAGNTFGNTLTELANNGTAKSGTTGYAAAGLSYPVALALDAAGNAWVANPPANSVSLVNAAGVAQFGAAGFSSGLNYPYAVAIDASGKAWIANHGVSSVAVLGSTPAAAPATYTGAGLNLPNALALDGAGEAWLTNSNNSISVLSATGTAVSGTTGYTASLNHGNGVAIDGSGNVWVTSCGSTCTGGAADPGSVVELVGAAAPVVTPLAVAIKSNMLATRP